MSLHQNETGHGYADTTQAPFRITTQGGFHPATKLLLAMSHAPIQYMWPAGDTNCKEMEPAPAILPEGARQDLGHYALKLEKGLPKPLLCFQQKTKRLNNKLAWRRMGWSWVGLLVSTSTGRMDYLLASSLRGVKLFSLLVKRHATVQCN